jgi:hypothetical protein
MALLDFLEEGPTSLDDENAFSTANDPGEGDTNAGAGGITTSAMTNELALYSMGGSGNGKGGGGGGGGKGSKYVSYEGDNTIYDSQGNPRAKMLTPGLSGNPQADHPYWTVLLFIVVLAILKFTVKGDEGSLVNINARNVVRMTLMTGLGFLALKFLFGVWVVASVSPTVEML